MVREQTIKRSVPETRQQETAEQDPSVVLMVRPANFGYNPNTAASNHFQKKHAAIITASMISEKALIEFDAMHALLRRHHIEVLVIEDPGIHNMPDAVFPNNWISFHEDGTVVHYPMLAPQRRLERQLDIFNPLCEIGFTHTRLLDLTGFEVQHQFLEGTGSLVLDRINRIAYSCHSPRSHPAPAHYFAEKLGYRILFFNAVDLESLPIYHTNVMLSITQSFAIVCAEAIGDLQQRACVLGTLAETGHEIIQINQLQLHQFLGNVYAVYNRNHELCLIMSDSAYSALHTQQKLAITKYCSIIHTAIPTIEHCGGGSTRCMLAGIHLPRVTTRPQL